MTGWVWLQNSRIHWARTVALPEIARLTSQQRPFAALRLIQQAERYPPADPELESFRQRFRLRLTVHTDPQGADFWMRDYLDVSEDAEWIHLGRTPLESIVVPAGMFPYRITKAGFESLEGTTGMLRDTAEIQFLQFTLAAEGRSPPGMIWVPARATNMVTLVLAHPTHSLSLDAFWLDKHEVTNRKFAEFVDRGGYEKREYWKQPFIKDGRVITWEEAMAAFVDATGRPGPATWTFGTYPKDQGDFPVGGVSWYEAAAYAEFAGKSLPTVHHWRSAAGLGTYAGILQVSNYFGNGPARVGSHRGLSPYGNYDMAGNVREWCWNPAGEERYALGGAWNDPSYTFYCPETRPPMDRSLGNGFRCARYDRPPSEELTGPVPLLIRDRRGDKPATNSVYEVYRAIHQYDRGDLKAAIDERDDTHPDWRLEKVSFQAAYADERVNALLYLPKGTPQPYQVVVYFPGAYCLDIRDRPVAEIPRYEYLLRSGRALMYPTYKGTFDRSFGRTFEVLRRQPNVWREMALQWASDLGRSLDYLETRADIDAGRMAYLGNSMGAVEGPRLMALNPRLKAGLLLYGGCWERGWPPAEVDPFHFAPRVRAPVLMVNGRDDFIFPLATSQTPLFRLLGASQKNKRHFVVDGGHGPLNQEIIREILGWLDQHLGPVRR
jgi:formylglycine-generating enzyme required for sulfatase activity/dienelactone hydrolase